MSNGLFGGECALRSALIGAVATDKVNVYEAAYRRWLNALRGAANESAIRDAFYYGSLVAADDVDIAILDNAKRAAYRRVYA